MLSKLANWFKSNSSRYFALDEEETRTRDKDYYISNRIDTPNLRNYNKYSNSFCRNHTFGNSNTRLDERFIGHNQRNYRLTKAEFEIIWQPQFFINEVRDHYNNLDKEIYQPLSTLGINEIVNNGDYPSWKSHLKVIGHISDKFLTNNLSQHISNDNENLLPEIAEYIEHLKLHNRSVESLPRVIDSIIKSKFIEAGIYPTQTELF